jgi:acetyl-CoA acetyltransferase
MRDVVVLGAGLHRYGLFPDETTIGMGVEACGRAFEDAGIAWSDVEVGYCASGRQTAFTGHAIAGSLGTFGATMTNVENASASGCSAFREAYMAIASGLHEVAIAIGVDKLREYRRTDSTDGKARVKAPESIGMMQGFAQRAREHMAQYGTTVDQLARISVKSHRNGSLNPYAHFQEPVTLEEVRAARMVAEPLTVLHCCPWDDGAAAVVLASAEVAARFTQKPCPRVLASACTGMTGGDPLVELTQLTAYKAYDAAGCGPPPTRPTTRPDAARRTWT